MTDRDIPPVLLTVERLEELGWRSGLSHVHAQELFGHIHALEAALQAARAERDDAVIAAQQARSEMESAREELSEVTAKLEVNQRFLTTKTEYYDTCDCEDCRLRRVAEIEEPTQ